MSQKVYSELSRNLLLLLHREELGLKILITLLDEDIGIYSLRVDPLLSLGLILLRVLGLT